MNLAPPAVEFLNRLQKVQMDVLVPSFCPPPCGSCTLAPVSLLLKNIQVHGLIIHNETLATAIPSQFVANFICGQLDRYPKPTGVKLNYINQSCASCLKPAQKSTSISYFCETATCTRVKWILVLTHTHTHTRTHAPTHPPTHTHTCT